MNASIECHFFPVLVLVSVEFDGIVIVEYVYLFVLRHKPRTPVA